MIEHGVVVCDDGSHADWLRFEDGRIAEVGTGPPPGHSAFDFRIDALGGWVLPGFVDIHVHGGWGHRVMDGQPEVITALAQELARHGVTAFAPSTTSAPRQELRRAVEAVATVTGAVSHGATILGAHVEGPWISGVFSGAHPIDTLRGPDRDEVAALLATQAVRSVTLAPELPGADSLIDAVLDAGGVAVLGHTDATAAQVRAAADAGVRHVTHLFNAMRGFHHRAPGAVGAALTDPRLTCEVIADGVHVANDALRLAWAALGPERMVLVTDANPVAGLGDGVFRLPDREVHVAGAAATLPDGTIAGSVTPMDVGFARLCRVLGVSPATLWPVASRTPAHVMGISDRKGTITPGHDADLVVLDPDLEVQHTLVDGVPLER